ncbi:hypothetical protein M407DRAFT_71750 [Tulasnella calospora MUT 4182]|uniref:MIF4G domain-containing protein n=1 Tax=Tulasnella calospora MUT 4182 TaxID=1051891 RepID=A0A0C3L3X5_9AGAM|nr:hypothetical protein M407DRAFT_71750 [Tulasnella calospora MUT 4182]
MSSVGTAGKEDEASKRIRRQALKNLNLKPSNESAKALESSLKRHTAFIKRMKQSMGAENRDANLKDIETLVLEKYVEEAAAAALEGLGRCKTEKDVWSAVEVISALHRRFPTSFTPPLLSGLAQGLTPPAKATLAALPQDQREKDESARVARQRPLLRVYAELALVGILADAPGRSGGETILKTIKDLLSGDPQLGSLPLLTTFLKSYARPFLGISPSPVNVKQQNGTSEETPGADMAEQTGPDEVIPESEESVEQEARERFKKMCEGYYDNVAKKLVREHDRLQDQDKRNHEAYIRSGEIFEDRQQAYEKMAKGYEKLLTSCQTLSELLHTSMPNLPKASNSKSFGDSIAISLDSGSSIGRDENWVPGGKWEDEEERRFFEDLTDLKDFVPRTILGIEAEAETPDSMQEKEKDSATDVKQLEDEMKRLEVNGPAVINGSLNGASTDEEDEASEVGEDDATPTPTPPRTPSPTPAANAGPGPSQLVTAVLAKLSDATNRELIDQAAVDFAFLNSKSARKRLVKYLTQVPKSRLDLLPYLARMVATLGRYMPDIPTDLISFLDEQFRYLHKKKRVIKELADTRRWNLAYISALTKFSLLPTHVILHMYKVYVDDFSGVSIDNLAMFLEGCGRFLLRDEATGPRMAAMVELMRRKQSLTLMDQRQTLLLENAYYMCNPPERGPRQEKERSQMVLFIRHLIFDVLAKKTIDKVLKLIRKLDWDDPEVQQTLHKIFTRPWKVKYANVSLLALLTYDLQRYHATFSIGVVDQVLEDTRRGLELNIYKNNQRRVATMKLLGELYIYRMISSAIVFDTLWSLVTFGHPNGRPLPGQVCPIDAPDDFFRVRLVCVLLDSCGMCFDKGSLKKKLDAFLTFFQLYVLTKEPLTMDVDFMLSDTMESLRPNLAMPKTFEDAALAVDQLFSAEQNGIGDGEDSGEDEDEERQERDVDEEDDQASNPDAVGPVSDRPGSPDEEVVLSHKPEHVGPSAEEEADFNKELAKMMLDSTQEARKVDRKAAAVMWETAVMTGGAKKKKEDTEKSSINGHDADFMKFTLLSRKGNRQITKDLVVPESAPIAVHTRNAQLQDKFEQQQLKKLVLDYEYREGMEEYQGMHPRFSCKRLL